MIENINIKTITYTIALIVVLGTVMAGLNNTSYGTEYQIDDSNNNFYDYSNHRAFQVTIPSTPWDISWSNSNAETELAVIDGVYKTTTVSSYVNEYHTAGQLFEFQIDPASVIGSVDFTGKVHLSGASINRTLFIWNNVTQNYDSIQELTINDVNYTIPISQTQIQNGIVDSDNTIYLGINATNGYNNGGIVISSDYIMLGTGISTWNETWINIIIVVFIGLIILASVLVKTGVI